MTIITTELIKSILKIRLPDSHKGSYGHALLIAGNTGRMGAAIIAATACVRSGVGLVTVNVPFDERSILQTTIAEAMLLFREEFNGDFKDFSCVGIGPGLGITSNEKKIVKNVLKFSKKPMVLDADALNIIATSKNKYFKFYTQTIITPHPKEFDRLFGEHPSTEERIKTAVKKALEMNMVVVLKGQHTIVTDGSKLFKNIIGNSGLAKGGSGDALTGLITGLLAQKYTALEAALAGVYIHALAADIALKTQSMESMIVTDVIANFGEAFKIIFNH